MPLEKAHRQKHVNAPRRFLLVNTLTNLAAVGIWSLVSLWLTRFLLVHLGLAVFGLVPLINSIVAYVNLANLALSSSVGRFAAIRLNQSDDPGSIIVFNSGLLAVLAGGPVTVMGLLLLLPVLTGHLDIPLGHEDEFSDALSLVVISAWVAAIASVFQVSTFVTHRLYLQSITTTVGRALQVAVIAFGFTLMQPSLRYVGVGHLAMSGLLLATAVVLGRRYTPQLALGWRHCRWASMRQMGWMGGWVLIDQVGSLLYLSSALVVISVLLGSESVGYYAPGLQLTLLLRTLSDAPGSSFAPVAIDLIAQNRIDKLAGYTKSAIKLMGLALAVIAGVVCGLSEPLLRVWLGDSFSRMNVVVWLLIGPQVVLLSISPLYNITRGLNRVKVPALVTIAGGVLNVLLSVALVVVADMGLAGVALATVISLGARAVLFTPLYVSRCLKIPAAAFLEPVLPGLLLFSAIAGAVYAGAALFPVSNAWVLAALATAVGASLAVVCYRIALNDSERALLRSVVGSPLGPRP